MADLHRASSYIWLAASFVILGSSAVFSCANRTRPGYPPGHRRSLGLLQISHPAGLVLKRARGSAGFVGPALRDSHLELSAFRIPRPAGDSPAEVHFDWILDRLTGRSSATTDYILIELARGPNRSARLLAIPLPCVERLKRDDTERCRISVWMATQRRPLLTTACLVASRPF